MIEMKTRRCPRGKIVRNAYTRTSASGKVAHVASVCINDVGLPGKRFQGKGPVSLSPRRAKRVVPSAAPRGAAEGPGIGQLDHGELSKYGYEHVLKLSAADRHAALSKAVGEYGWLTVFRKLNAVSVLTRNTSPETSVIFLRDRNWVKRTFGIRKKE